MSAANQLSNHVGKARRQRIAHSCEELDGPLFSILMPVYDPPRKWFIRALDSIREQAYGNWELCIADDASPSPWVAPFLEELAQGDSRIKVALRESNGHISAATNSALDLASGDYVVLMDNDDELSPLALLHIALHIRDNPGVDVIYSDEDQIDERGLRFGAYRKPDWNPDLLLSHNVVSHLGVYRRSLVERIGGFRLGFEGSQDLDLALRATSQPGVRVGHVPYVLYHWRTLRSSASSDITVKPYAFDAAVKAIDDHLAGTGTAERRMHATQFRGYRIHPTLPDPMPSCALLRVDPADPESVRRAVDGSSGDVLIVLSDQVSLPERDGWEMQLIAHLERPGIGAVGGAIVDRRGRIRDGALWVGAELKNGWKAASPAWAGISIDRGGPDGRAELSQSVTALSFGFFAIRRDLLARVGGIDPGWGSLADVELCLRLKEAGHRCLWLPEITCVGPTLVRRDAPDLSARLLQAHPAIASGDANLHPSSRGRGSYAASRFDDALGVATVEAALQTPAVAVKDSTPGQRRRTGRRERA